MGKQELEDKEDVTEDKSDKTPDADEEDNSDDSDDSSSDDAEDKGDTDDSDGEDFEKKYFTDPKSVDPKLAASYKKMQGVFTKKMQEASGVVKEAKAFRELVVLPEFQQFMEDYKKGVIGNGRSKGDSKKDDEDEDEDTPVTKKDLNKLLAKRQQEDKQAEYDKRLANEFTQFKKNTPDWEIYKEPMKEILAENPNLSYEKAYYLASMDDDSSSKKKDIMERKKRANVSKPNKTGAKGEAKKEGKKTIWDAFHEAKRTLGVK